MKQQFVATHPYTFLQEMEITWQFINRPAPKYGVFLQKYKDKQYFYGHSILTEGVFVTQLSSNVGISSLMSYMGYDKLLFHEQVTI